MLKAFKKADSNYYSFKQLVGDDFIKIEVYSTPSYGKIRHAITGLKTPYTIASKYDDLFFTVVDSSCISDRVDNINRRKLYYNNPEEYERHFHVTVSKEIKHKWSERNRNAKSRIRK
jgi:hypothetical protein